MNILIINHYAGSPKHGMEYRHYYLAREWVRLGHKVTIVAASYSHLRSSGPEMSGHMTGEEIDGVRYLWLKTPRYRGNGLGRVRNMATFGLMLVMLKSKVTGPGKPDLVIASSPHPFIIYGARKIAGAAGAKLMFEVRDLWPLTLTELGGISPRHPFIITMQKAEDIAYRVSDCVVSLLPKAGPYMQEHDLGNNKFVYIPNGICLSEWKRAGRDDGDAVDGGALSELRQANKFIVGYAGAHGLANELYTLIDAAALVQDHPVAFVLVGQGPEKEKLKQKVSQAGLKNVSFLDSVPRSAVPQLLASMDILYIGLKKEPLFRFGVSPNKLMDYMMAGKPVIHAIDAGNDMVFESGCGVSVPPEDPRAVANAAIKLINMTADERKVMGLKGQQYVAAHHDYGVLAKRYLEAFEVRHDVIPAKRATQSFRQPSAQL